jgi:hypothetical protein
MKKYFAKNQNLFFKSLVVGAFLLGAFVFSANIALAANSDVVLSEVTANSADEDTGEFVELYNKGAESVDVSGWLLKDGTDINDTIKDYSGTNDLGASGTTIPAGGIAVIVDPDYAGQYNSYFSQSSLASSMLVLTIDGDKTLGNGLSNSADTVILDDKNGYTASFSWTTDAGDGVSFQKIEYSAGDSALNWTTSQDKKMTPGDLNNISALALGNSQNETTQNETSQQTTTTSSATSQNHVPKAEAGEDIYMNAGGTVSFDASASTDQDGNNLTYIWNLGDGSTEKGATVKHIYNHTGTYFVSLQASDGMAQGSDQMVVYVYPAGIFISEFLPNPEGEDSGKEWIEIYNSSNKVADIGSWQITDRSKKVFVFPQPTLIKPNGYLVLDAGVSKISLNNSDEEISLLYPNDEIADKIAFNENAKEGYSAARFGEEFLWTKNPSPGIENAKILSEAERKSLSLMGTQNTVKEGGSSAKNKTNSTIGFFGDEGGVASLLVKTAEARTISGYLEGEPLSSNKEMSLAEKATAGALFGGSVFSWYVWLIGGVVSIGALLLFKKLSSKQ